MQVLSRSLDNPAESAGFSTFDTQWIGKILDRNDRTFSYSRISSPEDMDHVGRGLRDVKTGLQFRLVVVPSLLPEVQRCRLLLYYCDFDPRIKPLLGVVHHWPLTNKIRLGETNIDYRHTHCHVPDPGGLEWLVVFFLCQKGIIPTPREVQKVSHKRIGLMGKKRQKKENSNDMGFSPDPKLAADWAPKRSPKFQYGDDVAVAVRSVLELAADFFYLVHRISATCGTPAQCILLNTRDGEILNKWRVCEKN